jgi:hypothetical protein
MFGTTTLLFLGMAIGIVVTLEFLRPVGQGDPFYV